MHGWQSDSTDGPKCGCDLCRRLTHNCRMQYGVAERNVVVVVVVDVVVVVVVVVVYL